MRPDHNRLAMNGVTLGTVARIRVERGGTTEFPVVERVRGGWQTGVHFYPDELVTETLGTYAHQEPECQQDEGHAAAEEALSRYHDDIDSETGAPLDDWGYSDCQRQAFIAGALFERQQFPTRYPIIRRNDWGQA